MQARDNNLERQKLESFVTEIQDLIKNNQLELATKRVGYFAEDFAIDKKRKYEAIDFQRRYAQLQENKRKGSISAEIISRNITALTYSILEFVDLILEEYNKLSKPKYNSISTLKYQELNELTTTFNSKNNLVEDNLEDNIIEFPPPNENQENNSNEIPKTPLEKEKQLWKEKRDFIIDSPDNIVVYASNITKQYSGKVSDFKLILPELELKFGEITSLVGENGNGKTTLLRIIIGELAQSSGVLKYPVLIDLKKHNWYQIKQQIAYIPQELPKWSGLLVDNLHFAAAIHGIKGKENEDEVDFILWRLGLDKYRNATWNEISGGFKMRFALAKALVWKPKLLVLDEPLANLDVNTQLLFLQDLRYLADSLAHPKAIILSSQHLYEVESITNNIVFIKEGSVLYNGKLANFGEDREENAFELGCRLSKEELMDILEKISYTEIQIIGHHQYIVNTSRSITANDMMKLFIDHNITLKYFRDISKSTRRLFKTER
ncbi:MAG: ATP-binding cassette domain-containing protein [Crocosphaera sp.]|nr:ATP-binding cassette domain-containing protein [Crocosphaera sp.]